MDLYKWATKWGVRIEAVHDLMRIFGASYTEPTSHGHRPESIVQKAVRLEMARSGGVFWRNNSGGAFDEHGNFFRYGLCNDTAELNKIYKSADLVGLRPIKITAEHVGQIIGRFVARECKPEGWRYTGTPRERAQLNWLRLVAAKGGDAAFADSEGSL